MAPRTILAQLAVVLRDDASKGAKALSGDVKGLERSAVDFTKTMQGAKWGSAFTRDLGFCEPHANWRNGARDAQLDRLDGEGP